MSKHAERRLAEDIASFAVDPFGHAMFAYPWGEGILQGLSGPRQWQCDVLREIGSHLSNPTTRFQPLRIAVASGHGAGKSSLMAMVGKWALDTCSDCRVVLTANTEGQLVSKSMPEILKWHGLSLTKEWFRPAVTSLASAQRGHAHSWRLEAIPWSIHQPEAFAGLHNAGRRIVLMFDEASSIPPRIWEVAEGALTDHDTEIVFLALGNPTRAGRFKDCFGRFRNMWKTRHIDSRTVEGTNKQYLTEIVEAYGEDSDFTKVRVRGLFPSASSMQFIGSDLVEAARTREPFVLPSDPLVFGLDHARFGTDSSVLAIRQGRDAKSRPWKRWQGANSMEIAGDVAEEAGRWNPHAIFVDAGGPNAGGVIDRLRQLTSVPVFEVHFGGKGKEARFNGEIRTKTANKRAAMWTDMRAWLENGAIPADNQRLVDDLTSVEYTYDVNNAVLLEKKDHLRARGLASPDEADALALTFAEVIDPLPTGDVREQLCGLRWGDPNARQRFPHVEAAGDIYSELYE